MDYFSRTLIILLFASFAQPASAITPAGIVQNSYCYSNPTNTGTCSGGARFGDAKGAAAYACQKNIPSSAINVEVLTTTTHPVGMAAGLNNYGKFYFSFECKYRYNGTDSIYAPSSGIVTAEPDCGAPIMNYSPASCSGDPPNPNDTPVACVNTNGAIIPAFHMVPVASPGCYAGCSYTSVNTSLVEWNGGTYESGTWSGVGVTCSANDIALFGGVPGNAQSVNAGGLSPGDLLTVAQETTLQSVLAAIQAGTTSHNQNSTILERIAAATESTAAGSGGQVVSDPDGLEAAFVERMQAVQVDANGKLPDSAMNAQTVDVGGTFANVQGFVGVSSCPASPTFTVMGQSYSFDISMLCMLAEALSYLVVALASMAGAKIFIGGM